MYYLPFIMIVLCFLSQLNLSFCAELNPFQIHSILPAGPYSIIFKDILTCDSNTNYKIQLNLHFHKKSNNSFEIQGNSTFNIQMDDTMFFELNMAIKDPVNGWKENVYFHKAPNGCSSFKLLIGNVWNSFMYGLGMSNQNCPISVGTYIAPGLDTSIFMKTNIPKSFIYGTYKLRVIFSRNNEIISCTYYIVELTRLQ